MSIISRFFFVNNLNCALQILSNKLINLHSLLFTYIAREKENIFSQAVIDYKSLCIKIRLWRPVSIINHPYIHPYHQKTC